MEYTYDPARIRERGKDQMRFELGDTNTDGGADTCALADEEYAGLLEGAADGKKAWMNVKLQCLEAIMFKLSYQVDTKIDVLQYAFGKRAEAWQRLYDKVKADVSANSGLPTIAESAAGKPPYFYTGIKENKRSLLPGESGYPLTHTAEAAGRLPYTERTAM